MMKSRILLSLHFLVLWHLSFILKGHINFKLDYTRILFLFLVLLLIMLRLKTMLTMLLIWLLVIITFQLHVLLFALKIL